MLGEISVLHQPEQARQILGYMPDFPPVYDDLRVEEFCDLFAHAYGQSVVERKEKVERALALTELTTKRREICKSLSRGMKQRALLAKTLIHDPSVMLLDEPGANLDPKARIDMRKLLRKHAERNWLRRWVSLLFKAGMDSFVSTLLYENVNRAKLWACLLYTSDAADE